MEFNIDLFWMINDLGKQFPAVNPSMVIIAEYMVLFLALSVIVFWFTRKNENRMMVICGGFSFIFAEIIGKLAGKIHSNQNPFAELSNVNKLIEKAVDNSFPSDHTILFFSFCVTFWLFKKGWGFLWILLAFLVGISRIWVGVHYPADVFVGAVISTLVAAVVYYIVPRLQIIQKLLAIYEKAERAILPAKGKSKEF